MKLCFTFGPKRKLSIFQRRAVSDEMEILLTDLERANQVGKLTTILNIFVRARNMISALRLECDDPKFFFKWEENLGESISLKQ